MSKHAGILAVTMSGLWLGGCGFDDVQTGPERNDPISLDAGKAERANVELNMGAGQLIVGGGGEKLLSGHFEYNVDAWKPEVTSSINGARSWIKAMHSSKKNFPRESPSWKRTLRTRKGRWWKPSG